MNSPTRWSRAREWLWSSRLAARAARVREKPSVQLAAARTARVHASLAEQLLREPASFDARPGSRRALTEASLAMLRLAAASLMRALQPRSFIDPDDPLAHADSDLIAFASHALPEADSLDRTREALAGFSLAHVHERPDAQLREDVSHARALVRGLLLELELRTEGTLPVWRRRFARTVGVALALGAALWLGVALPRWLRPNLAADALWTSSSSGESYPQHGRGFAPPPGRQPVFFHTTNEENPWVEFDLGSAKSVHNFTVSNRGDCCQERAVPLVVELSTDHARWTEVARRDEAFSEWSATIATQPARWVRFRVPRATTLHLHEISIQ